ncbi:MAG: hypothetical protein HRT45_16260 [Bdellovibrionales bacterium]|nr:hypothetical protein [Bdellovibrionales bacterium]
MIYVFVEIQISRADFAIIGFGRSLCTAFTSYKSNLPKNKTSVTELQAASEVAETCPQ